ncbi:MAG: hypothetical protein RMI51_02960 [Aquificaceae bacterium]|nr:hypothetical protein [Aquificaceae bacterium]
MFVFLALLLFLSQVYAKDYCLKRVENPYPEPYLGYLLRKRTERAILESGHRLRCQMDSQELSVAVESFKETPIGYTPQQRVNAYNLEIKVRFATEREVRVFSAVVSYTQLEGGLADLPRRSAIEDAMNIIYTDMLNFFSRR